MFIKEETARLFESCEGNVITRDAAIAPELEGLVMFDSPLVGIASAHDEMFESFRSEDIIGSHYMTPSRHPPSGFTAG